MAYGLNPLDILVEQFRKMPGIGGKSAQRLAFHILNMSQEHAEAFVEAIMTAKNTIHYCSVCSNLTDAEECSICSDPRRDHSVVCVVAEPVDVMAVEKTKEYTGTYHVLHGLLSPADNIGPNDIRIKELLSRIGEGEVKEVIIATDPTVEGDATAIYLSRLLKPLGVKVTRLAFGLPVGGELEYADELTLSQAIENRRDM